MMFAGNPYAGGVQRLYNVPPPRRFAQQRRPYRRRADLPERGKRVMERQRRMRIDQSIIELRSILLECMPNQRNRKLEYVDVIEMAVEYLKCVQRSQNSQAISAIQQSYFDGFSRCASAVLEYFRSYPDEINARQHMQLVEYLDSCVEQRRGSLTISSEQTQSFSQDAKGYGTVIAENFPCMKAALKTAPLNVSIPPIATIDEATNGENFEANTPTSVAMRSFYMNQNEYRSTVIVSPKRMASTSSSDPMNENDVVVVDVVQGRLSPESSGVFDSQNNEIFG